MLILLVHAPHFKNHLITSFYTMFPKCSNDPWKVCNPCREYQQYPCKNRATQLISYTDPSINFLKAQIKRSTYQICVKLARLFFQGIQGNEWYSLKLKPALLSLSKDSMCMLKRKRTKIFKESFTVIRNCMFFKKLRIRHWMNYFSNLSGVFRLNFISLSICYSSKITGRRNCWWNLLCKWKDENILLIFVFC